MTEQKKAFVITDRRKFTLDGQPRRDSEPSPEKVRPAAEEVVESSARVVPTAAPVSPAPPPPEPPVQAVGQPVVPPIEQPSQPPAQTPAQASAPAAVQTHDEAEWPDDPDMPGVPTAEQLEQSRVAFETTARRVEIAIRAANPGLEEPPEMSFESLIQSVYMTALMQLGEGTPPGQKPQVDLLGARQSIDTLTVIADKTKGNLPAEEQRFVDSALFQLRLAFLEVTQTFARSGINPDRIHTGPSIVR